MSEVIKRDKQVRLLSQLYNLVLRDGAKATPAIATVWRRQLDTDFATFKKMHAAVIDRAGSTDIEEQHLIYDDANNFFYKASIIIEERLAVPVATNAGDVEKLRIRHTVAAKRLAISCERVRHDVADMQVCELDLERNGLESAFNVLQQAVMDRIAAGVNEDAVLLEEARSSDMYRVSMRLLADARARRIAEAAPAPAAENPAGAIGADALRLPHLQITPFDGQFDKWEAFRESFEHGVHARVNMAAVQKLQYLKSVLRGEPEELI